MVNWVYSEFHTVCFQTITTEHISQTDRASAGAVDLGIVIYVLDKFNCVLHWLLEFMQSGWIQDVAVGSFVMWVQANVSDSNSTVQYKLTMMTPGFSIDHQSGVITTATTLNLSTTFTVRWWILTYTAVSRYLGRLRSLLPQQTSY